MGEKRLPEPGAAPPREADEPAHADREAPPERAGPLAVQRLRKDDGRALIAYRRVSG